MNGARNPNTQALSKADSPKPTGAAAVNNVLAARPLGGRIKMDPWDDELSMLKAKPVSIVADREKMPFEITPFVIYLTRDQDRSVQNTPMAATSNHETPAVATSNATADDPGGPGPDAQSDFHRARNYHRPEFGTGTKCA